MKECKDLVRMDDQYKQHLCAWFCLFVLIRDPARWSKRAWPNEKTSFHPNPFHTHRQKYFRVGDVAGGLDERTALPFDGHSPPSR